MTHVQQKHDCLTLFYILSTKHEALLNLNIQPNTWKKTSTFIFLWFFHTHGGPPIKSTSGFSWLSLQAKGNTPGKILSFVLGAVLPEKGCLSKKKKSTKNPQQVLMFDQHVLINTFTQRWELVALKFYMQRLNFPLKLKDFILGSSLRISQLT